MSVDRVFDVNAVLGRNDTDRLHRRLAPEPAGFRQRIYRAIVQGPAPVELERMRRIEAAARDVMDLLAVWTDSDGRERIQYPVDRDGDSDPKDDAIVLRLRDALQSQEAGE